MSKDFWATYSVTDHLEPRSLVADIMLYDRLVFPVPQDSSPPGEWTRNNDEWTRWKKAAWDPDRQEQLLELLGPVSRKVPWEKNHKTWRKESARLAAEGVPDYAFQATRTALTLDLPAHIEGVAAVGPAYRTFAEIQRELGVTDASGRTKVPEGALATVLGWAFLTPEDDRLSDEELLKETVDFVTDDVDFRRHRSGFLEWQQDFLKNKATDAESIKRALDEMEAMLEEAREATSKLTLRKVARYSFMVAPSALALSNAIAGVPDAIEVAKDTLFLSLGAVAIDEWLFKSAVEGLPAPVAFVNDVHQHFGWE